jgi:hypothetical protein
MRVSGGRVSVCQGDVRLCEKGRIGERDLRFCEQKSSFSRVFTQSDVPLTHAFVTLAHSKLSPLRVARESIA